MWLTLSLGYHSYLPLCPSWQFKLIGSQCIALNWPKVSCKFSVFFFSFLRLCCCLYLENFLPPNTSLIAQLMPSSLLHIFLLFLRLLLETFSIFTYCQWLEDNIVQLINWVFCLTENTLSIYIYICVCANIGLFAGVALSKGEMGDCPRPHLKIRPHPKKF